MMFLIIIRPLLTLKLIELKILCVSYDELDPIGEFRNRLVHFGDSIEQYEITKMTKAIESFSNKYMWLEPPFI